tara:strand:- start:152 stop:445 length:294 start_codon:yes stop_codon:yes gene_type:complete
MKITKEELMQIIKEEIADFGKQRTSRSAASAALKQRSKDMQTQQGVDDGERGIITQIETLLTQLADKTDIRGGRINYTLKKLYNTLKKELGDDKDEK